MNKALHLSPMIPSYNLEGTATFFKDILEFTQEMNNPHPAAFPVELVDRIIQSTNAEIILDPFMGSGTTGIACLRRSRSFIGIERSEKYFEIACERIRKAYAQPDLFIAPPEPQPKQEAMI